MNLRCRLGLHQWHTLHPVTSTLALLPVPRIATGTMTNPLRDGVVLACGVVAGIVLACGLFVVRNWGDVCKGWNR